MDDHGRYHSMADYPERVPSFAKVKAGGTTRNRTPSPGPLTDDERKNGPPVKRITPGPDYPALGVCNPSGWPQSAPGWPWKGSR